MRRQKFSRRTLSKRATVCSAGFFQQISELRYKRQKEFVCEKEGIKCSQYHPDQELSSANLYASLPII